MEPRTMKVGPHLPDMAEIQYIYEMVCSSGMIILPKCGIVIIEQRILEPLEFFSQTFYTLAPIFESKLWILLNKAEILTL